MPLSDDKIASIIGDVEDELRSMSKAQRATVTQSEESLLSWLWSAVRELGSLVGEVISAPFRAVFNFFAGLFEGLFK